MAGFIPWPADRVRYYRDKGYWRGQALGSLPGEWAAEHGDRVAVVAAGDRWTYAELNARSGRTAVGLQRLGIRPGDRVVVQLPNVAEFFEVLFALWKLGAIPVVVLPAYRRSEVSSFCRYASAVAHVVPDRYDGFDFRALAEEVSAEASTLRHVIVVGDPGRHSSLDAVRADAGAEPPPCRSDPGDVALLHLSGGTTGTPKLIPRTHDDYLYGARASADLCGFAAETVYLCCLPAAHQFPLSAPGALGTFLSGGRVVMASHPAPDIVLPLVEEEHVTVTSLVPPLVRVLLDAAQGRGADVSSLRLLQVGGARLSPELARRVRPVLGCQVQQVFGMTEGLLNFTRLDDPDDVVCGTQGRPLSPDDEIRLVDEYGHDVPAGEPGHLLVRGPNTIRGYYDAPEYNSVAFTDDGFYRTGDIVRQVPSGHLVVVGRLKDQINKGGEKIAAEEVEGHLLAHPDVVEAAVVAMPDPFLGERVCAFVVAKNERRDAADLAAFVRSRGLAGFKVPDRVEFVETLPRTAVGKISKQALRARMVATTTAGGS